MFKLQQKRLIKNIKSSDNCFKIKKKDLLHYLDS